MVRANLTSSSHMFQSSTSKYPDNLNFLRFEEATARIREAMNKTLEKRKKETSTQRESFGFIGAEKYNDPIKRQEYLGMLPSFALFFLAPLFFVSIQ